MSKTDLTPAQSAALAAIREGRYSDVRSGPHLRVLAEKGLIERGADSRYAAVTKWQPCLRGNDTCPKGCCAYLSAAK